MARVEIFDNMSECTDDEVARMLPLVSQQRREQALRYKFTFGRYACLKSYMMLQKILENEGVTAKGESIIFGYGEYGKPYLTNHPEVHFSISHCRKAIAVAVDERPVGIDIECFHNADEALLRLTMSEEEQREISVSQNPAETFTCFWTQKEALLKMQGTGINVELQDILLGKEPSETHVNREKEYVWSIKESISFAVSH